MAGIIGHIDPFDEAGEQWATFSVIGPKAYGLLRSLVAERWTMTIL